jgi:threonine/homoserine/homoserine lactone efflux protein
LGSFILGYVAVLAVPGPNLLALGGLVALKGFRAAFPFGIGAVLGATILAGLTQVSIIAAATSSWRSVLSIVGALLLLLVAARIALAVPEKATAAYAPKARFLEFASGLWTALVNPVSAAFFVGQCATLSQVLTLHLSLMMLIAVLVTSTTVYTSASALLALPIIRQRVVAWHGIARASAAAGLVVLAACSIRRAIM